MIVLTRRRFLQLASAAALAPSSCVTPRTAAVRVNDVHSQLNETYVAAVRTPRSAEELREIVQRGGRSPICIAGGRHAMGGQQFASNATLIDIRSMKSVLSFDEERGIVEVESGIQWPELVSWLIDKQQGRQRQWGIAQKQTGADRLTLAGSLAANAHGRGLTMKPIAGDVESFTLINAAGDLLECSRSSNRELFALAIGGYGLFGPMASIRLRLRPRQKVERVVEEQTIDTVMNAMEQRIAAGYLYGDFQFSIDDASADFLKRGVFSCYRPVPNETPIAETQRELKPEDWGRLLFLAHADKKRVYEQYVGYYLTTTGQVYWSDEHQMSFYADDYHSAVDRALGPDTRRGTEMITELYVPRTRLADFMSAAAEELRRRKANVIYGTVRLIERDDETFLPWARDRYACIIFNLHIEHAPDGKAKAADAFRALIDLAIARSGSYFLTYHRYARRDQVEACYPKFAAFLRAKRRHDRRERFQSEWYRHYKAMFGA